MANDPEILSEAILDGLRAALHRLVKAAWRRKALQPAGLPVGVVALDGKVTALPTLNHHGTPRGLAQRHPANRRRRHGWIDRVLGGGPSALQASSTPIRPTVMHIGGSVVMVSSAGAALSALAPRSVGRADGVLGTERLCNR